jgi:hypothetical protein
MLVPWRFVVCCRNTGADITLGQMLYDNVWAKRQYNTSDTAFNDQARRLSEGGHLPPGNKYPRDLNQAKQLMGVPDWKQFRVRA